ncbi:uncharacterized protein LOC110714363 [Chenopodium quinoa]|uniref:uncharacterized protein LOC110714363 n=1 Tax=Chenopodium quinoa TaxID=63459 RepID=UPI000B778719|nr:uncharacterized protein LOC110714363 [Chenopodium quinoa]
MVENHEKYLGFPTVIGRSKKAVFAYIKDRIWKKLQGWEEKLLSRAGKEVLLKSVIQAIPTYLMGVYKFPSGLIQEIHGMMARFWWGSNDKGKQVWRLATNEHSLVSRVFKAKYFPHSSIFEAALGPISSYSWQSLWSSKALVKEGMFWRVGNGNRINIWSDPWLIDDESRFATSARIDDGCNMVAELIDVNSCCWKLDALERTFNDRDKVVVLAMGLVSAFRRILSYGLGLKAVVTR